MMIDLSAHFLSAVARDIINMENIITSHHHTRPGESTSNLSVPNWPSVDTTNDKGTYPN
jgi:hypothetical protein